MYAVRKEVPMKLDFNGMVYALSYALDCVEAELVGVETGHGKWVAYLSVLLGREFGMTKEELLDLAVCAALHDNALTQYIAEEKNVSSSNTPNLGLHCILGEENIRSFPFHTDVTNVILYHHENANGTGLFQKKAEQTPLMAQIIHFTDILDANCHFQRISRENCQRIKHCLEAGRGVLFEGQLVDTFLRIMPEEKYLALENQEVDGMLEQELPSVIAECSFEEIQNIMNIFAKIVDYKSIFTRNHSVQLAQKLLRMADFYGYDSAMKERLFVAGTLHDIGKMAIGNDVLEKPDKLTDTEFAYMQNHAWYTYVILSKIQGFEDITRWASRHHEKLNGRGYPFGLKAEELEKKERLVACIDIYQALSEDRPYKPGMAHEKCISIMRNMAENGFIDAGITEDINQVLGELKNDCN